MRIVFIAPAGTDDAGMIHALSGVADVQIVQTAAEAAEALAEQDALVCSLPDLLLLSTSAELDPGSVLAQLGVGACLIDRDGGLVWANQKARSFGPEVIESVRRRLVERMQESAPESWLGTSPQTDQFTVSPDRNRHYEITAAAIRARGPSAAPALAGRQTAVTRVLAMISDVTRARAMQDKISAIDQAGRELVGIDADASARLEIGERLQMLEDKTLRFAHDLLHFDHLVIRVLDPRSNRLDTVVAGGLSKEAAALEILAKPTDNGISGYVAATGKSYICDDVSNDPRYLPGLDHARSTLTVPLWLNHKVVGTMNIESELPHAFNDDDRQIAEIFGRYVAIGLHMLKLLAVERSTTTGQVAADVGAEVASPLNAIASEAAALMATAASPEVLSRLQAIVDQVDSARAALRTAAENFSMVGLKGGLAPPDAALAGKRILVADDEDIIRETVCDVLTRAGAVVISAADGAKAIEVARTQSFDLVLSDIKMPFHNGYEVFAAVRKSSPTCPVILITGFGYDPNHSIVRASKEGLAGVLFKPFKVDQLLDEVRRAITGVTH